MVQNDPQELAQAYWAARTQQMSAHENREHPEATTLSHEALPNITRARMRSPCRCNKKTHSCPIVALEERCQRAINLEAPGPSPLDNENMKA